MSALQRKDNVAWIPPSKRGGSAACSLTAGLSGHSRRSADPPAQAGQSHPRPPEGAEPHGPLHRPSSWERGAEASRSACCRVTGAVSLFIWMEAFPSSTVVGLTWSRASRGELAPGDAQ
uniref:Uncharacterized protein n=1 Tax=Molossus molossus TaxID=27622 RepID=A0A7J8FZF2_MOLMO|nr:hypothetical protein HJG59_008297 [Molossus molossus]